MNVSQCGTLGASAKAKFVNARPVLAVRVSRHEGRFQARAEKQLQKFTGAMVAVEDENISGQIAVH